MALATDALEWRTQREQDIRDAYADKNRWTALDYVTDQHDYSFRSIEAWPLDAAVIYNPTDRAALLLGSLKAACSLEDIVETTSLKVTVVVTMCAQEMQITAPTDWTKYFEEQDVFHIQCHLEDTTLKPTRRWLEQIPNLVASCLRQWKIVCRAVATSEKTSVASLAQSTLCLGSVEGSSQMFGGNAAGQKPPCQAGREAGANYLMCEPCQVGLYAEAESHCQECPPGAVPSEDRGTCEQCPPMHYSVGGLDTCFACDLPLLLVDNHCVWWHLPLVTLGLGGLAVGSKLLRLYRRSRRAKKAERILEELYNQLWDEQSNTIATYSGELCRLGLEQAKIEHHISAMRAQQSQRAGVSIRYLLSAEFAELAMHRTGKDDPTFIDMKTAFWLSDDPIGRDVICPRDGRAGCALVDWIPRNERREQSHFMSWTWKYSLRQVRSALEMLQHSRGTGTDPTGTGVSFFMCFFVNNQYRLIVEECANGSDNLEDVFEGHLKRIGRMVAILDTWDQPVYLSRVWTVYEQYVASTIGVQVQFVLPKNVADRLRHQIAYVPAGIEDIIESLCQVDSEQAKAWKLEDEIKDTVGFKHVDMHVTDVMITWIGDVIEQTCTQWLVWRR
ncbi:unnamed protein product [Durusdinium trenchii]|uniref:TIR domain-containing protein n=1 Tax=Durusdinium trenchii TaxID=1381693 RepID=A0ABP0HJW8_9DINO